MLLGSTLHHMKQRLVLSILVGVVATVLLFAYPSHKVPVIEFVEMAAFWTALNTAARIGGGYGVLFVCWFLLDVLLFSLITLLVWKCETALLRKALGKHR